MLKTTNIVLIDLAAVNLEPNLISSELSKIWRMGISSKGKGEIIQINALKGEKIIFRNTESWITRLKINSFMAEFLFAKAPIFLSNIVVIDP